LATVNKLQLVETKVHRFVLAHPIVCLFKLLYVIVRLRAVCRPRPMLFCLFVRTLWNQNFCSSRNDQIKRLKLLLFLFS